MSEQDPGQNPGGWPPAHPVPGQPGQYPPPAQNPPAQAYPGQQPPAHGQPGSYPPGGAQYPPGGAQYPPGGAQYPSGGAQYPPGGAQYPPGGAQYPPGGAQYPPGGAQYPPPGQPPQPQGQPGQYPPGAYPGAAQPGPGGQYPPAPQPGAPQYGGHPQAGSYGAQPGPWATPGVEILANGGQIVPPPPRSRRRLAITMAAVVAVVAGGSAAGAYAWSKIGGGGDQPEQHLPGDTAMVMRLDLDPSWSQKVDALRFATKFPGTPRDLDWKAADRDPRKWIYDEISKNSKNAPTWSEVSSWLGKRAGIGLSLSSGASPKPIPMVVVQVKDEAKAKQALGAMKSDGQPVGVEASDGWVLISDTPEHARAAVQSAKSSPLSKSPAFSGDVEALGDQGIASLWFDYSGLARLSPGSAVTNGLLGGMGSSLAGRAAGLSQLKGHGAVAVRFSGANLEIVGKMRDVDSPLGTGKAPGARMKLPADSIAAVELSGLGDGMTKQWPTMVQSLATLGKSTPQEFTDQIEQATGLQLPTDIKPLLGDRLGVAVQAGSGSTPAVGARVESGGEPPARVNALLEKLVQQSNGSVTVRKFAGGYTVASTADQADALASGQGGDLASTPRFKNAVPDADGASVVMYVDLAKAFDTFASSTRMSDTDRQSVKALEAFGLSVKTEGDHAASFSLRLTTR